ncbi:hypothetical protein [Phytobacter diazotrophicus]|uniref:hypothetical protein n=1 Tax=Phytobacter diazotrophicus TaxID=395631 RepID=UPI002FFCE75F
MNIIEMNGFLTGKCLPGDMRVNETDAEYLVRKFSEKDEQIRAVTEQRDALVVENVVLIDLARKFADRADDYKSALMGFNVSESFDQLKSAGTKEYTDAARASLRAEGVEMLRYSLPELERCLEDTIDLRHYCSDFARQLRERKGANHE